MNAWNMIKSCSYVILYFFLQILATKLLMKLNCQCDAKEVSNYNFKGPHIKNVDKIPIYVTMIF